MIKRMLLLGVFAGLAFAWVAAGCADDDDGASDAGTDTDTDTDTDADTDVDTGDCTGTCHGHPPSVGSHFLHLAYTCCTCHGTVVDVTEQILDQEAHVDGIPDITPEEGTYDNGTCSDTTCHLEPVVW